MMGLPQAFSTTVALVFIETSIDPLQAPAIREKAMRKARLGERPGRNRATANPKAATRVTFRLPTRAASQPMVGMSATAPSEKARSARLSCPSERPSDALNRGSCAAQVPMPKPLPKKIALAATRARKTSRLVMQWLLEAEPGICTLAGGQGTPQFVGSA